VRPGGIDPAYPGALVCFALSGFAALLYETVWTRDFALAFGTAEPAVAAVLAAYMGGLAAGAALARRPVQRVRRPLRVYLRVYALLELGIGISALAVPDAVRACTRMATALFGGAPDLSEPGLALAVFHLLSAFTVLLVPTALMGATLPLLARFAVQRSDQLGRRIGTLYAVNTGGAVAGTLTAAFVLLPQLGLRRTLWIGVAVNLAAFGLAALLSASESPSPRAEARPMGPRAPSLRRYRWILALVGIAGITSFTYEVLWTRLLGHIFGGTIYAFATMLASFLTGIALGSALAVRVARDANVALRGFAWAQIGIAVLSVAAFRLLDALPALALTVGAGRQGSWPANASLAAIVLIPGAVCMGAAFPLAVRVLASRGVDAGPASARVYAWNTAGAILGAVGAAFVWLPLLGYSGTLVAAAAINLTLALAAALLAEHPRRRLALGAALTLAALVWLQPGPPMRLLRTSPLDLRSGLPHPLDASHPAYLGVGRSTTVLLLADDGGWSLRSNGLPEATIRPRGWHLLDDATQWLGALPVLARPDTASMLVIGLGGGSSLEAVPASVTSIDVLEIEPEMVAANREVASLRAADPLADPRVRIHVDDARGALARTQRRWDAIVSQPSHPWTAGASHLFTREFFALVRSRLDDDGVFVQWMGVDFVDEGLLRSLAATLDDAFGNVRFYSLRVGSSIAAIASAQPLPVEETAARALATAPEAFAHLGVYGAEELTALLVLDEEGIRKFSAGAPLSTDDHNLFQLRSPRVRAAALDTPQLDSLLGPYEPLVTLPSSGSALRLVRRRLVNGDAAGAERIADRIRDPVARLQARGLVDLARGERERGEARLRDALHLEPDALEARAALARLHRSDAGIAEPATRPQARRNPELEAVLEGWTQAAIGDWKAVARREERLGRIPPAHPLYADALRLRAEWRLESGEPERAREALSLIDRLLPVSHQPRDVILRARALHAAGNTRLALATLLDVTRRGPPDAPDPKLLAQVARALSDFPDVEALRPQRNRLSVVLHRRFAAVRRSQEAS
jgi:spermidine synthase